MPSPSVLFTALRAKLGATAAITDLVGDRIEPEENSSQSRGARVTYGYVIEDNYKHMEGSARLTRRDIQLTAWSITSLESEQVADAIEDRFNGIRAELWSGIEVRCMDLTRRSKADTTQFVPNEQQVYGTRLEFSIWFQKSAPTLT